MKLSWIFTLLLLVFVAVFSVQNAQPIEVHLFAWKLTISSALVIQLAALLGGLVGLAFGLHSRSASIKDAQREQLSNETGPTPVPREPTPESP